MICPHCGRDTSDPLDPKLRDLSPLGRQNMDRDVIWYPTITATNPPIPPVQTFTV